jgi:hypothetical protein
VQIEWAEPKYQQHLEEASGLLMEQPVRARLGRVTDAKPQKGDNFVETNWVISLTWAVAVARSKS